MPWEPSSLTLSFLARGSVGRVNVDVWENIDPLSIGSDPSALGFPVCRAIVDYDPGGDRSLIGWVQVVGLVSADGGAARQFEADPLQVFAEIETPFAFYGINPQLFDAPSREDRDLSLDWLAHSFLCIAPSSPMATEVEAVAGFSWGFRLVNGEVVAVPPERLHRSDWAGHTPLLSETYLTWNFGANQDW